MKPKFFMIKKIMSYVIDLKMMGIAYRQTHKCLSLALGWLHDYRDGSSNNFLTLHIFKLGIWLSPKILDHYHILSYFFIKKIADKNTKILIHHIYIVQMNHLVSMRFFLD
jgi:hypothetical protein